MCKHILNLTCSWHDDESEEIAVYISQFHHCIYISQFPPLCLACTLVVGFSLATVGSWYYCLSESNYIMAGVSWPCSTGAWLAVAN